MSYGYDIAARRVLRTQATCHDCGRGWAGPEQTVHMWNGAHGAGVRYLCPECDTRMVRREDERREEVERQQRANANAVADGMAPPYPSEY